MLKMTNEEDRPKGIPDNWVINPHNNPDISLIGKIDKKSGKVWIPHQRENWINPEALKDVCKRMNCDGIKGHDRKTNAYYIQQAAEKAKSNEQ